MLVATRVWNYQDGRKLCSKQLPGSYAGSGLCVGVCVGITAVAHSHCLLGIPKQI